MMAPSSSSLSLSSSSDDNALLQSLQATCQTWSAFDLDSRRPHWDRSAQQTKEHREESQVARKHLAEVTKQFKKCVKVAEATAAASEGAPALMKGNIEPLSKECRSIVKAYQEEVDNLTRRCKTADASFLGLYQVLYDLPDPAPVLGAGVQQMQAQHMQIRNLLQAMEELNSELTRNQEMHASQINSYKEQVEQLKKESNSSGGNSSGGSGGGSGGGMSLSKGEREELLQLRREVSEYEVEFRGLKNQDITIRKLEAKIVELQKNSEEELQRELQKAQQDLAETEGRRATDALEREAAMERRVQTLELQLRSERAGREVTQASLLRADSGAGEREAAWEAQRQILVDDSERLREQLHMVTRERDDLRLKTSALVGKGADQSSLSPKTGMSIGSSPASGNLGMGDIILERKAYEAEVSELSHTANSLREELRAKEESMAGEKRAMEDTIDGLKRERSRLTATVASLEAQLHNAPSEDEVASMRRELGILKSLEYNAIDADDDDNKEPEMTTSGANDSDLETVLVAKLRKVESELVRQRNERKSSAKMIRELEERMVLAEKEKEEAEKLVASLEADLHKAVSTPVRSNVASTPGLATKSDPLALQQILDPSQAPPPSTSSSGEVPVPAQSQIAIDKANDDHSVATIVMAQRDRLRVRCDALEAERDSFKRELQVQVQSAESLKTDNTKLYEKVRYLQTFSNSGPRSGGGNNRSRGGGGVDRDLDLEALEQRYEASVDPFRQFSRSERQRKMKEMSPAERVVFVVAKTVLGTKEMRTALFFYMLGMHILVFVTTYHWSHSSASCHSDVFFDAKYDHMHGGAPPLIQSHHHDAAANEFASAAAAAGGSGGGMNDTH